jgi:hypothetical protein
MAYTDVYVRQLFNAESISASGDSTSTAIDLGNYAKNGYFSLHLQVTGSGTVKAEYLLSNINTTSMFKEPSTAVDITSTFGATSGPDSDGVDLISFLPEPARWMKIKITEDGGASAAVVTAYIAVN